MENKIRILKKYWIIKILSKPDVDIIYTHDKVYVIKKNSYIELDDNNVQIELAARR